MIVPGSWRILFTEVEVVSTHGQGTSWQCSWCGWVTRIRRGEELPDHECYGPTPDLKLVAIRRG